MGIAQPNALYDLYTQMGVRWPPSRRWILPP